MLFDTDSLAQVRPFLWLQEVLERRQVILFLGCRDAYHLSQSAASMNILFSFNIYAFTGLVTFYMF